MIFVPMQQSTPTPTRRSRELTRRLDDAVREFRRDHPDLTDDEIRAAMAGVRQPESDPGFTSRRRRQLVAVGLALVAAVCGVVISEWTAASGMPRASGGSAWIVSAAIVALAIAFVVLRIRSRQ